MQLEHEPAQRRPRILIFLGLSLLLLVLATAGSRVTDKAGASAAPESDGLANCRYGATPLDEFNEDAQTATISTIGAGWYLNFDDRPPAPEPDNDADFVPMIHINQSKTPQGDYLDSYVVSPALDAQFAAYIQNHPDETWIIGNEMERGPQPGQTTGGQGDTFANVYARAYHDVRQFILQNDPGAKTAITGLVEVTPGRLQYLQQVWDSYLATYGIPMPIDVWTMHVYVLPEVMADGITPNGIANVALGTDPALGKRESGGNAANCPLEEVYCFAEHDDLDVFAEQVTDMRQWMKDHGQQNKPLVISEFSILYPFEDDGPTCFIQDEFGNCFTPQRVSDFMTGAFNYLNGASDVALGYPLDNHRLVQQWMWFAVFADQEGEASNLLQNDLATLTLPGQTFMNATHNEATVKNLIVDTAADSIATTGPGGTATAPLTVTFRNNGNVAVDESFEVRFYSDQALTNLIGTATVDPIVRGCATSTYEATVQWSNLTPGTHDYWVLLDSEDDVAETPANNDDNVGMGQVLVFTQRLNLPAILR